MCANTYVGAQLGGERGSNATCRLAHPVVVRGRGPIRTHFDTAPLRVGRRQEHLVPFCVSQPVIGLRGQFPPGGLYEAAWSSGMTSSRLLATPPTAQQAT
jgi:hypothetical protein